MNVGIDEFPMKDLTQETLFQGLAASAENVYLFETDIEKNYSVWSDNAVEYFGFPEGYGTSMPKLWLTHIHPEDLEEYQKELQELFEGKRDTHHCQYRAKNALGEYVWLECIGRIVYAPNQSGYFVGIITRLDTTGKYDSVTKCLSFQQFYLTSYDENCSLMLLGFDGFRKIVNSIGYARSNRILALMGEILCNHFGLPNVYRMTGDEFLVVMKQKEEAELTALFEELQAEFKAKCLNEGFRLSIGFSGGATSYIPDEGNKEEAIKNLEHSLEFSKQSGKEVFSLFSTDIEERHLRTTKLKYALSDAIKHDFEGFSLAFQPVVRSCTKEINGVEVLLRFHEEELGNVSPMEFIPLLEETGKIREVGLWVAAQAVALKAQWEPRDPGIVVGFNVSLKQLKNDELIREILRLVDEYQVNPAEIVVELTESCKVSDLDALAELLKPLDDKGIRTYLDDFGMEQSSFSLVQKLPVRGVKIDHSFVRVMIGSGNERTDRANVAIVSSIIYMCKQLDLSVVCEGIETQEIGEIVCNMDARFLQGYYYSRPLPQEEFEKNYLS